MRAARRDHLPRHLRTSPVDWWALGFAVLVLSAWFAAIALVMP